ncbi:serine/threonine-protein kinase [Glycomyces harbinensis]|uniref:non-specific serine/threonine protein kinase n=1 Tax=Glycomyces harbinensis TaxID=58114 RepID=A0A1G6X9Q1_9ACTN|nr:serine/threonine-protein kinase [Glycomyces harbinensis]SDD74818.1 Serine/threonine protein kinase [Glycomyces harbinensis]
MRAGQVVGDRYRLEERLGSGSQGEVWRAVDLRLSHRSVALKRALVGGDPAAAAKVRREAETLAHISHPNVVTVYDTVDEDGDCWIVMEFVQGHTLAELGTVSGETAARYGAQLAGGLAAAHAAGILHRDIKPANVLVTDQGHAKLADFGIARRLHAEPTLTGTGAVTGTPGYVAPEVARGGKFTAAADTFSLGATLFHAVEGTSPFGEGNPHALLWRTAQGERIPPKRAGALAPVLDRLLQTEPKRRPRLDEASRALGELCGDPTIGAVPRARRPRRWVWAGAAAAALVVLAAAGWIALRPSEAATDPPADGVAVNLIGDEAGADPCALLDAEALSAHGETRFNTDNGNFNRCDLIIDNPAGDVDVIAYFYETTADPESGIAEMVGSIGVLRHEPVHEECDRTLVLPDGNYRVAISAEQESSGENDLCAVAETAVDGALAVLQENQVPRRESEPEADSLFHTDVCGLLDDEALEHFPGVDADHPARGFAGWECFWSSTTSEIDVKVEFDRDEPPSMDDGEYFSFYGRDAFNEEDHWGDDTCLVSVVHRQFASPDQDGTITAEYVRIQARGPEPLDELCAVALGLAEPLAMALPDV